MASLAVVYEFSFSTSPLTPIIPFMSKTILLATSNPGKVLEFQEVLGPLGYRIVSPKDLGLSSDPEENGTTYRENAFIKAFDLSNRSPYPVLADDSGLEIRALGNEPGIHTARYAKQNGGFPAVFDVVMKRLEGQQDRFACFHCSLCLIEKVGDAPLYFDGECPGTILFAPSGTHGFGYDPIFHSQEADIDFGLASEEIKNRFSHRGKAIAKLVEYLSQK